MNRLAKHVRVRHLLFAPVVAIVLQFGGCFLDREHCRLVLGQFVFFDDRLCLDGNGL